MSARVLRNLMVASLVTAFVIPLPIFWHERDATALAAGPAGPVPPEKPDEAAKPGSPALEATLVDASRKAAARAATVQVDVTSVRLIDPDGTTGQPVAGEGHLHYQVDDGPVIATTTTKLGFHELAPGKHDIKVVLAAHDHKPISATQTINLSVPGG